MQSFPSTALWRPGSGPQFLPNAHLPTVFSGPAVAAGTGRPPSWHRISGPWGKGLPTLSSCGDRWPSKYHPPCTSVSSSSFTPCCVVLESNSVKAAPRLGAATIAKCSFWCTASYIIRVWVCLKGPQPPQRMTQRVSSLLEPCRSCARLGGRPLPTEHYCWPCNFVHQDGCKLYGQRTA